MTYPSEPGLEGELSEDREVTDATEATDRGRCEEGMVKERTMERGRLPRRSSTTGCGNERTGEGRGVTEFCAPPLGAACLPTHMVEPTNKATQSGENHR